MMNESQLLRDHQRTYHSFLRLAVISAAGCIAIVALLAIFAT